MQSDIRKSINFFDKNSLKHVQTRITQADGSVVIESSNGDEEKVSSLVSSTGDGYVYDYEQDLQIGEIRPGIIIGSQDAAHDSNIISRYKVSHILNVATSVMNIFPDRCTYKNLNLVDFPTFKILPFFREAFDFIDSARIDGCCLVHCNYGISRSATIVIGYLMETERLSLKEAYDYIKEKRPAICPNFGFMSQLKSFESQIFNTKRELDS